MDERIGPLYNMGLRHNSISIPEFVIISIMEDVESPW